MLNTFKLICLSFGLFCTSALAYDHDEAIGMMTGTYDGDIHLKIGRFHADNFGNWAVYAEYRMGGKDEPVSRQRVYAFGWMYYEDDRENAPIGMAFDFPDGEKYIGAADDPSKLDGLLMADLAQFPIDCMLYGEQEGDTFILKTQDKRCKIVNPELGPRVVDLTMTFSPDGMTIEEVGYDEAGNFLFGTEDPIKLTRVTAPSTEED